MPTPDEPGRGIGWKVATGVLAAFLVGAEPPDLCDLGPEVALQASDGVNLGPGLASSSSRRSSAAS